MMCDVYRNALFTISAAHAPDGNVGCFVERDGLLQRPHVMPFTAPFPKIEGSKGVMLSPLFPSRREITKDPAIYSRAWVLQERALSRRTIHFSKGQTYWECGSIVRCANLDQMTR